MSHFQDRLAPSGLGLGALFVSASAVILGLAGTTPATATLARSAFALPVLAVLAARERRRSGGLTTDRTAWSVVCGVLFCGDMLLWTQSISEVGAGLSTVLVNAQVAIVPLLAWLIDRERVPQRFRRALPVVLTGVVLAGGVLEHGVGGSDPFRGTLHAIGAAVCYSGFLFLLRRGGRRGQPVQTYTVVLVTSAVLSIVVGPFWHGLELAPGAETTGWLILVTVTGQLLGWLLVAYFSPRLPSDLSSALLLLTPIGAIVLSAVVLDERPSPAQLVGCTLILLAGYLGTSRVGSTTRRSARFCTQGRRG
ncbi:DMT family transporter [Mycobacterium sp. URHB0021]|jgi:drug/metabolite transporter (DMT)-like permease